MFSDHDLRRLVGEASTLYERLEDSYVFEATTASQQRRVKRRLRNWKESCAGGDADRFQRRLDWIDRTPDSVAELLGKARLRNTANLPAWARELKQTLAGIDPEPEDATPDRARDAADPIPFEHALFPFLNRARERLREETGPEYDRLSPGAHAEAERGLLRSLSYQSRRVFYKTFASRSSSDSHRTGGSVRVASGPSNRRYQTFIRSLREGAFRDLFLKYSVSARVLTQSARRWKGWMKGLLHRLGRDRPTIGHQLVGASPGQVVELELDSRRRTLIWDAPLVLRFESGDRVVYKPRSLEPEQSLCRIQEWLNDQNPPESFPVPRVLSRTTYGWMEFVPRRSCSSDQEVEQYYRRLGQTGALCYVLRALDMHGENFIAHGNQPVCVDAQTIFQPRYPGSRDSGASPAGDGESEPRDHPLIQMGFLPSPRTGAGDGHDLSALGGGRNQPDGPRTAWRSVNTDRMNMETIQQTTDRIQHIPHRAGNSLRFPGEYRGAIGDGFEDLYRLLMQRRDEIASPSGPLLGAAPRRVQVLPRARQPYYELFERIRHPSFQRSGIKRSLEWDALARPLLTDDRGLTPDQKAALLESEHRAIEALQFPAFRADIRQRALEPVPPDREIASGGHSSALTGGSAPDTIPNYFVRSGWDRVRKSLDGLGEEDLEQCLRRIRTTLDDAREQRS